MLFAQAVNFWSISLFDQSVSFFYVVLAAIGAVHVPVGAAVAARSVPRHHQAARRAPLAGVGVAGMAGAAPAALRREWSRSGAGDRR
jgi:Na+/H+-dicarboxylate symporter